MDSLSNLLSSSVPGFSSSDGVIVSIIFVVYLIIAALNCFFGYKLQRLWITILGFIIGFGIGMAAANYILQGKAKLYILLLIGIVVGVLVSMLAFNLYKAGIFIWMGGLTFITVSGMFSSDYRTAALITGIAAGILVGILAVKFMKPCIIIATALNGAFTFIPMLFVKLEITNSLLTIIVAAVAAVLGAVFQFALTRDKKITVNNRG